MNENTQIKNVLEQLAQIQEQLRLLNTPSWTKTFHEMMPMLAAITSGLCALAIAYVIFVLNKKKDKKQLMMKLYGEAFSIQQDLIVKMNLLNYNLVERKYFELYTLLEAKQKKEFDLPIKLRDEQYKMYFENRKETEKQLGRFLEIIGSYYYMNPQSGIMQLYTELRQYDYTYSAFEAITESSMNDIETLRSYHHQKAGEHLLQNINTRTWKIVETIKEGK
jgi:hypothetical protein